jgi:hypothetical protein
MVKNGRCKFHGGLSTGPRTPEGLERSRRARWKHGAYSQETKAILRESRRRWRELLALVSCGVRIRVACERARAMVDRGYAPVSPDKSR